MEQSFLEFLNISSWQSVLILIFLMATIIVVIFMFKMKIKTHWIFLFSVFFGLLVGVILGFIFKDEVIDLNNTPIWYDEMLNWLNLAASIFISLFILFIPLLLFVRIVLTVVKQEFKTSDILLILRKSLLLIISTLFIFIVIPLFNFVDLNFDLTIADSSSDSFLNNILIYVPTSISIFTSIYMILGVVIFGFLVSISVRVLAKKDSKISTSVLNFFDILDDILLLIFKWIFYLLPIVIATQLPILFLQTNLITISSWSIILGCILILLFIISLIILLMSLLNSKNKYTKTEFKEEKIKITKIKSFFRKDEKQLNEFKLKKEKPTNSNSISSDSFSIFVFPIFFLILALLNNDVFLNSSGFSSLTWGLIMTNIILCLILVYFPISNSNHQNIFINSSILFLFNFQTASFLTIIIFPFLALLTIPLRIIDAFNVKNMLYLDKIIELRVGRIFHNQDDFELTVEATGIDLYLESDENNNKYYIDSNGNKVYVKTDENDYNKNESLIWEEKGLVSFEEDSLTEENIEDFNEKEFENIQIDDDDIERNVW